MHRCINREEGWRWNLKEKNCDKCPEDKKLWEPGCERDDDDYYYEDDDDEQESDLVKEDKVESGSEEKDLR